jgi:hypothetical protein
MRRYPFGRSTEKGKTRSSSKHVNKWKFDEKD